LAIRMSRSALAASTTALSLSKDWFASSMYLIHLSLLRFALL
jgi:hypothetical protein